MTDDMKDAADDAAAKMQIDLMMEMILKIVTKMLAPAFQQMGCRQLLLPHAFAMCARTEAIMCAVIGTQGKPTPPEEAYEAYVRDFEVIFDLPTEAAMAEVKRTAEDGGVHFLDPNADHGVTVLSAEDSPLMHKMLDGMRDGNLMEVVTEIAKGGEAAGAVVAAALAQHKAAGKG